MGYVKNALAKVHEEGCLWLEDHIIEHLRESGLDPRTRHVVVEGFGGPVELDALPKEEATRILPFLDYETRTEVEEALRELEERD
jgi:hypothetical protein